MAVLTVSQRSILPALVILRVEIVALTLATAAIHASLGGTLFLLNAVGYAARRPGWSSRDPSPTSAGWCVRR